MTYNASIGHKALGTVHPFAFVDLRAQCGQFLAQALFLCIPGLRKGQGRAQCGGLQRATPGHHAGCRQGPGVLWQKLRHHHADGARRLALPRRHGKQQCGSAPGQVGDDLLRCSIGDFLHQPDAICGLHRDGAGRVCGPLRGHQRLAVLRGAAQCQQQALVWRNGCVHGRRDGHGGAAYPHPRTAAPFAATKRARRLLASGGGATTHHRREAPTLVPVSRNPGEVLPWSFPPTLSRPAAHGRRPRHSP